MKKNTEKLLFIALLILQLVVNMQLTNVHADEINTSDSNLSVSANVYIADPSAPDGYKSVIEDGVVINGNATYEIELRQSIILEIIWNLDDASSYSDGDYIVIPLPESFFDFDSTDKAYDIVLSGSSVVAGQFEIIKGTGLVIKLNAIGTSKPTLSSGKVSIRGSAIARTSSNDDIKILGKVIPLGIVNVTKDLNAINTEYGTFFKVGSQVHGSNDVCWEVMINISDYIKALKNEPYELLDNIVVIDNFAGEQTIGYDYSYTELEKHFSFTMPIYAVKDDGNISDYLITSTAIDFSNPPTIIVGSDGTYATYPKYDSVDDFIEYITGLADTYVWGIYEEGSSRNQYIIFKLPDMGNVVIDPASDNTVAKLSSKIDAALIMESEKNSTKDAYNRLAGSNAGIIPVLTYHVSILVNLIDEDASDVVNEAILKYGISNVIPKNIQVEFAKYESIVVGGKNGELEITKIDGNTKENISGASFRLQFYNPTLGIFEDYLPKDGKTAIRLTVDGSVSYGELGFGRYRIVAVDAGPGYNLSRVEYETSNEFSITGLENGIVKLTVKNYKTTTAARIIPNTGVNQQFVLYCGTFMLSLLILLKNRKVFLRRT